jgi:hypothetical protein
MSEPADATPVKVADIRIGDRLLARDGTELTVTRIDEDFLGRAEMVAFVEDTVCQWFKLPARKDGEVQLVRRHSRTDSPGP